MTVSPFAIQKEERKLYEILRLEEMSESDEETLQLIIESETNIPELAAEMIEAVNELSGMVDGIKLAEQRLKDRRVRIEQQIERLKDRMFSLASRLNVQSCRTPVGTFGTREYQTVVYEEGADKFETIEGDKTRHSPVPVEYWTHPEPRLDRMAVTKALRAGTTVPGARLETLRTLYLKV